MSKIDRIAQPRRSNMAICEDANLPVRGLLRSRPNGFFSDRYTLSVDYELKEGEQVEGAGTLRSFVDAPTLILFIAIGIPVLIFSILAYLS